MKPLSDKQRRVVCRLLYFVLCLCPLGGTTYLVIHRPTIRDWEKLVKSETNLDLRFARVETPDWRRMQFLEVQWADPELRDLSRISSLKVTRGDVNEIAIAGTFRLSASGLGRLLSTLQREMLSSSKPGSPWELRVDKLEIQDPHDPQRAELYGPLQAVIETNAIDKIVMRAQLYKGGSREPVLVELSRDSSDGRQGLRLATGDNVLPFWLLRGIVGTESFLISQGSFIGDAQFTQTALGLEGTVSGRIGQLDLATLTAGYQLEITGTADVQLRECRIGEGRIVSAAGVIYAITNHYSASGQKIMSALMKSPESESMIREFSTRFQIVNSHLYLDELAAIRRDKSQVLGPPIALRLQYAAHLLTSMDFLENPNDSRYDMANLNDRGVALLKAFQLDAPAETARQPEGTFRR